MANYYYVKAGFGTNTGATPYTSAQTGTFAALTAANCYDSLDALDTAVSIAVGDFINVSDLHNKIYATATAYSITGGDGFVKLRSVDDEHCDQYKAGAHEEVTSGDLQVNGQNLKDNYSIYGMSFKVVSGTLKIYGYHSLTELTDCVLYASGPIDFSKGVAKNLYNCTTTCAYINSTNSNDNYTNCTLNHTSYLFKSGIGFVNLIGCDCSGSTSGIALISGDAVTTANSFKAINSLLPTSYVYRATSTYDYVDKIELIGCDNYYNYGLHYKYSETNNDTAVYLDATYDGTNGFSFAVNTLAEISSEYTTSLKLLEIPASDLTAAVTFRVNLLTDNVILTDTECWLEILYPDNTAQALSKTQSSRNTDIMTAGTNLLEDTTNTWVSTGLGTPEERYISEELPVLSNVENGNVIVNICFGIASTDIWIDPAVVIS